MPSNTIPKITLDLIKQYKINIVFVNK